MFVSYFGIRVTDLDRSTKFYSEVFGLEILRTGDFSTRGGGRYVLLRDPSSGQRLELNWYPAGSPYATKYEPGEGLDHIGVKVESVDGALKDLASKGAEVVSIPKALAGTDVSGTDAVHIGFVKDPDGNWIGLYDHSGQANRFDPSSY